MNSLHYLRASLINFILQNSYACSHLYSSRLFDPKPLLFLGLSDKLSSELVLFLVMSRRPSVRFECCVAHLMLVFNRRADNHNNTFWIFLCRSFLSIDFGSNLRLNSLNLLPFRDHLINCFRSILISDLKVFGSIVFDLTFYMITLLRVEILLSCHRLRLMVRILFRRARGVTFCISQ